MTTAQTMLPRPLRLLLSACALTAAALAGCRTEQELVPPSVITSPYDASHGPPLWAVVPLRNESGTTSVDALEISDKVVAAASQVRGVRTLPLNRTLATMRAMNLTELASPADARALAQAMGVDGLILGSITAYDPYNPPKLGLALALYMRPGQPGQTDVDPRALRAQPTDYNPFPRSSSPDAPASVISEFLDGKDHGVQVDLREYARGRHEPNAALQWRRFLTSMDLYSEFAAWHAVRSLVDHEWVRLLGSVPATNRKQ